MNSEHDHSNFLRENDALEAATTPTPDVAALVAEAQRECAQKFLCSYYFSFNETGSGCIDEILSWIARAGKSYHHTDQWSDSEDGDPSKIDLIQSAANDAAKLIQRLATALTALSAQLQQEREARERAENERDVEREDKQSAYGYARDMEQALKNCPGCTDLRNERDVLAAKLAEAERDISMRREGQRTMTAHRHDLEAQLSAAIARADKAEAIIENALNALPVGYLPAHTPESIPSRITSLMERCAETDRIEEERDALRAELADWQQSFDLYDAAVTRAEEAWRAANPGNDHILPDTAKALCAYFDAAERDRVELAALGPVEWLRFPLDPGVVSSHDGRPIAIRRVTGGAQ